MIYLKNVKTGELRRETSCLRYTEKERNEFVPILKEEYDVLYKQAMERRIHDLESELKNVIHAWESQKEYADFTACGFNRWLSYKMVPAMNRVRFILERRSS